MNAEPSNNTITLTLTQDEADALLALLLRTPETDSLPAEKIEQLLFRILRKLPLSGHENESTTRK